MKILNERFPYRYVECGTLDNGFPDFRIQKADEYTKRYRYRDNVSLWKTMVWLDPDRVPCYVKDRVQR